MRSKGRKGKRKKIEQEKHVQAQGGYALVKEQGKPSLLSLVVLVLAVVFRAWQGWNACHCHSHSEGPLQVFCRLVMAITPCTFHQPWLLIAANNGAGIRMNLYQYPPNEGLIWLSFTCWWGEHFWAEDRVGGGKGWGKLMQTCLIVLVRVSYSWPSFPHYQHNSLGGRGEGEGGWFPFHSCHTTARSLSVPGDG